MIVYERSEFYIVIGAGYIVEEIEVKTEYMGGLADMILRCRGSRCSMTDSRDT